MFKYLMKGLLAAIGIKLLDNYRRLSVQLLKIEAARCYVHGVQMARMSALGLMWIGFLIALIGVGALLFHAGLFILLPGSLEVKAAIAMVLGLVYVALGWVALRAALDEKTWMEKSGAAKMLQDATAPATTD